MPQLLDLNLPHLESAAVVIDSHANEPAWDQALIVDEFVSYRPVPDAEPVAKATVRVLSDSMGLYVHYTVVDPEPESVNARYATRDNIWGGETAGLYLDPAGDGQRAYLFLCNPYGIQSDATRVAGSGDSFSWDGQWMSAGRVTDTGYEIEIGIPWSSVRHPPSIDQIGLSLLYSNYRESQRSGWPRRDPDINGILIQQAILTGPGVVEAGNQVQIIPELTFGLNEEGISQSRLGAAGLAPGLTLRWDPTAELQILGTANPDFSQVEGDRFQIDVNQRYALYYEEKRPFFLEGQEWLSRDTGVYTRSMVMPLVGVRATAEQGDWRTAVLNVIDAAPTGTTAEGGGWTDEEVEGHFAANTLVRTRRPFSKEGNVGAFLSHKHILGASMDNVVFGTDMRSRISDTTRIDAGQLSSMTTLADGRRISGNMAGVGMNYENREWEVDAGAHFVGKDFRAETGRVTETDILGSGVEVERMFYPEGRVLRTAKLETSGSASWRSNGQLRGFEARPGLSMRFQRNTWGYLSGSVWGEEYEDRFFQGAHGMWWLGSYPSRYFGFETSGGRGQSLYYDSENPRVVETMSFSSEITLRPTDRLSLSAEINYTAFWEESASLEKGFVSRAYLTTFFSDKIWVRSIFDTSSFSGDLKIENLLAWQRAPGTAAYLGSAHDFSEGTWQAFAKLSWTFGL